MLFLRFKSWGKTLVFAFLLIELLSSFSLSLSSFFNDTTDKNLVNFIEVKLPVLDFSLFSKFSLIVIILLFSCLSLGTGVFALL